ncbi:MAG: PilN domain-containing protein [bacterium]
MRLPAFFGHKRSINLLPRDAFESSTLGVILSWALVFGKWAVILTQLIVMGTFLWRFSLDRELTDLRKTIIKEVAIVKSYDQIERDFILAQKQVAQIKTTISDQDQLLLAIADISKVTPPGVWFDRMIISPSDISLTAYAVTLPSFGQFLTLVQNNPNFSQVTVSKIESSELDGASVQFEMAMTIKPITEDKK